MKNKLILGMICGIMLMFTACGQDNMTDANRQTEEGTITENEDISQESQEAAAADKDTSETDDNDGDLRSVAEGYIGKSCSELAEVIGECKSMHPSGSVNDNGKYWGYLHYEDFEVEFESDDETYLENGDISGCVVAAIVDTLFDE